MTNIQTEEVTLLEIALYVSRSIRQCFNIYIYIQIIGSLRIKIYLRLRFMGTLGQIRSLDLPFAIFILECLIPPVASKQ